MLKTRRIVTKCQTPSQLESAALFTRYESSNKQKEKFCLKWPICIIVKSRSCYTIQTFILSLYFPN